MLAGCVARIEVDENAQITCVSDRDCPNESYHCDSRGMCSKQAAGDPPGVNDVSIVPTIVGRHGSLRVTLSVTTDLNAPPVVVIGTATRPELELTLAEGRSYTYDYTPTGDEGEGVWPLLASLEDQRGRRVSGLSLGVVQLDFTPPAVTAHTLRLLPSATSPLAEVNALADGAAAELSFNTSEPLGGPPVVSIVCPGAQAEMTRLDDGASPAFFLLSWTLEASFVAPDGPCHVELAIADTAGNSTHVATYATFDLDRTAPSAALAIHAELLAHLRAPWGSEQTGPPGQFLVAAALDDTSAPDALDLPSAAFSQSGETLVEARVYASATEPQGLLGAVRPTSGGWSSVRLALVDSPRVWLAVIDRAGNTSTRVPVAAVRWVASLEGKIPGNLASNPHRFLERTIYRPLLDQPDEREVVLGGTTEGGGSWRQLRDTTPSARTLAVSAFNPVDGRVYLYGGYAGTVDVHEPADNLTDAFTYKDGTWRPLPSDDLELDGEPAVRPIGIAADPQTGGVYLYGIRNHTALAEEDRTGELWLYERGSWHLLDAAGPKADTMLDRGGGLVYDTRRRQLVLYTQDTGLVTWAGSWTTPTAMPGPDGAPEPRYEATLAYDDARGRVILIGGTRFTGCDGTIECTATWEWDGEQWLRMNDPMTAPAPLLTQSRAAYDRDGARTLVYGQYDRTVYAWDGASWTTLGGPTGPSNHYGAAIAYDEGRGRLVIFGGANDYVGGFVNPSMIEHDETWEMGDGMVQTGPATPTSWDVAYSNLASAGDEVNVLVPATAPWRFDGRRWYGSDYPAPSVFYGSALAFDSQHDELLAFGGFSDPGFMPTWVRGVGGWTGPTGAPGPTGRMYASLADTGTGLVLFGGEYASVRCSDSWIWTGTTWSLLDGDGTTCIGGTGPAGRARAAIVRDTTHNRVVLHGGMAGTTRQNDTWELYDGAWHLAAATGPTGIPNAALVDNPIRRGVVLVSSPTSVLGMHLWNGQSWRSIPIADPEGDGTLGMPGAPGRFAFANGKIVGHFADQTWLWHEEATRPGQLMRVNLTYVTADSAASFTRVAARAVAGGTGTSGAGCTAVAGAEMYLWVDGRPQVLGTNTAPENAPDELTWNSDADANWAGVAGNALRDRLLGPDGAHATIAIAPKAPSVCGDYGRVQTQYVELRLDYTLPP